MNYPTPLVDAWRSKVERALSDRGAKAELGRYLATQYGGDARQWQKSIHNILRLQVPNGEIVMAIDGWLARTGGKKPGVDGRGRASRRSVAGR